jgi:hypothetical protein
LAWLGHLKDAESLVAKQEQLLEQLKKSHPDFPVRGADWEKDIERTKAFIYNSKGEWEKSEAASRRAEALAREDILKNQVTPLPVLERVIDGTILAQGLAEANQGHLAQGEADVRRALLSRLKATGKYNLITISYVSGLGTILVKQGRLAEAEKLFRRIIDFFNDMGMYEDSFIRVSAMVQLAECQSLQDHWTESTLLRVRATAEHARA